MGGEKTSKDLNQVPFDVRSQIYDKLIEDQQNIFLVNKELSLELNRLTVEFNKNVNSLIPSEKRQAYIDFRNEVRRKKAEIPSLFKKTTESMLEEKKYRQNLVREARQFMDGLGIDGKKTESLSEGYIERVSSTFDKYFRPKGEEQYVITDVTKFPKETRNPWTILEPPFDDSGGWVITYEGRGRVVHNENLRTGKIETRHNLRRHDINEGETSYTAAASEVRTWYTMPANGRVEAWLDVQQNFDNYYSGSMQDECGRSHAKIMQKSYVYMSVEHPQSLGSRSSATLLDFERGHCDDCSWNEPVTYVGAGDRRLVHLFSSERFFEGEQLLLNFGLLDYNLGEVYRMSYHLRMENSWLLRKVGLTSSEKPFKGNILLGPMW